jgi:hypothetical protein
MSRISSPPGWYVIQADKKRTGYRLAVIGWELSSSGQRQTPIVFGQVLGSAIVERPDGKYQSLCGNFGYDSIAEWLNDTCS